MDYKEIINHYEKCFKKFGDTARGVDWTKEDQVNIRYQVMLEITNFYKKSYDNKKKISILDFGCGLSHFYEYLNKNDFCIFKEKNSFFAMTGHVIYQSIDKVNTVTHSREMIKYIRNNIGFKNILISDDLSMKSLKDDMKGNTTKAFKAGCDIALHCNGNINEMKIVANNSPLISKFIIKKTSQFYKILR